MFFNGERDGKCRKTKKIFYATEFAREEAVMKQQMNIPHRNLELQTFCVLSTDNRNENLET